MTDECVAGKVVDVLALSDIFFHSCKFIPCRSCMIVQSYLSYLGTGMMEIGKLATSTFPIMMLSFELLINLVAWVMGL